MTAAGKDAVAGFIFGNVVFPIIFEVLRVAASICHVAIEAKCSLEVGPAVAIVPHCLVRVAGTEYFHLVRKTHKEGILIGFVFIVTRPRNGCVSGSEIVLI